jgi:hypothetical protein
LFDRPKPTVGCNASGRRRRRIRRRRSWGFNRGLAVYSLVFRHDVATGQYVLFVFKGHDSFYQCWEDLKNFEDKLLSKNLKEFKQGHDFISQKNANIGGRHSNHSALECSRVITRDDLKYWCTENGYNKFN